ncbi:MAG: class I SAM-dependent methyltransferase [Nanoarchaeota archaeon]|nr:class I SAM-dependent methyltransferase [Nanoarchaeota archaeon]
MEQKEVWNEIAKSWSERRNELQTDVGSFLKGKSGRVLDLGCGSGRNMFKSKDVKFYGVDFSSKMIRLAEEKTKAFGIDAEFIVRDVWDTGYSSDFFDYGVFCSVLSCIKTPKKRLDSLKELYRVLKVGGEAMIRVWSRNSSRIKNLEADSLVPWTKDGKKYMRYYHIYEFNELKTEIEAAGFKILDSYENGNIVVWVRKE